MSLNVVVRVRSFFNLPDGRPKIWMQGKNFGYVRWDVIYLYICIYAGFAFLSPFPATGESGERSAPSARPQSARSPPFSGVEVPLPFAAGHGSSMARRRRRFWGRGACLSQVCNPPTVGDGEDWMQGSRKIGGPELTSRLRCRRSAEFIPDCEPQRLSGIGSICSLCAREASSAWVLCFHLRAPAIDWSTVW